MPILQLLDLNYDKFKNIFYNSETLQDPSTNENAPKTLLITLNQPSLVRTRNQPSPEALSQIIPSRFCISNIRDPKLKKLTGMENGEIDLNSPRGVCLGFIDWFIFLLKKQHGQKPNYERVANIFSNGAPKEALLLHAFRKFHLLNDKNSSFKVYFFKPQKEQIIRHFNNMPRGIYKVLIHTRRANVLEGHAIAVIKKDQNYVMDPNEGFMPCNIEQVWNKIEPIAKGEQCLCTFTRCSLKKRGFFYKKKSRKSDNVFVIKTKCINVSRFKIINKIVGLLRSPMPMMIFKQLAYFLPICIWCFFYWMKGIKNPFSTATKLFIREIETSEDLEKRVSEFFQKK